MFFGEIVGVYSVPNVASVHRKNIRRISYYSTEGPGEDLAPIGRYFYALDPTAVAAVCPSLDLHFAFVNDNISFLWEDNSTPAPTVRGSVDYSL